MPWSSCSSLPTTTTARMRYRTTRRSSPTSAFASFGVACAEPGACEEISIAAKTSMFQGFLTSVTRCKKGTGNKKRNANVDVSSVFDQRDEVQERLPAAVFFLFFFFFFFFLFFLFLSLFLSEPQVSSSTCGFGFIGVACSERVA